jgi:hypothetical protein
MEPDDRDTDERQVWAAAESTQGQGREHYIPVTSTSFAAPAGSLPFASGLVSSVDATQSFGQSQHYVVPGPSFHQEMAPRAQFVPAPSAYHIPVSQVRRSYLPLLDPFYFLLRPSIDGTYYGMAWIVRPSVCLHFCLSGP